MANRFAAFKPGQKSKERQLVGLDSNIDYTKSEDGPPCHTTGYGQTGGFASFERTPDMIGVSREACHGHGGTDAGFVLDPKNPKFSSKDVRKAGLVYPPKENVCRECHNTQSPFGGVDCLFDFNARVELGTHEHFNLKASTLAEVINQA